MTDFRIWLNHWITRHIVEYLDWSDDRLVIIPTCNPDLSPQHYLIFWLSTAPEDPPKGRVFCVRNEDSLEEEDLVHILQSTHPFLTQPIPLDQDGVDWIEELAQALYQNLEHRLLVEFIMTEVPVEPPHLLMEERNLC